MAIPVIVAGELKPIQFFVNPQPPAPTPASPLSLLGATATLHIQNPAGIISVVTCTVSTANPAGAASVSDYAQYITTALDFPTAGLYLLQLFVTTSLGQVIKSVETQIQVSPSL